MDVKDLIQHCVSNAPQLMWFLGAGASRTANMPSAVDIIWDLKFRYYCSQENQDIKIHDTNNEILKHKIQNYLEAKGFPKLWSDEEYSFYFELVFGTDYLAQQKYLSEKLHNSKISLNIGHKVLAGLLASNKTKIVFTTNFDEVIETAYSYVSAKTLPTYHLEGSYACNIALNDESFPMYAKMHGDFKYTSIKNLNADLLNNDVEIQRCFLAAATRYGLVVTGYSGRDSNVMSILEQVLELHNPFPKGLFWTFPHIKDASSKVVAFIEKAKSKGVNAHVIETGTFDTLMSNIWRQTRDIDSEILQRVNAGAWQPVNIPLPAAGRGYPIIRTNMLPVLGVTNQCARIVLNSNIDYQELKQKLVNNRPNAIVIKTDEIIAWGGENEFRKIFGTNILKIERMIIDDPITQMQKSTLLRSFYERGIIQSITNNRPIRFKNEKGYHIVADRQFINDPIFQDLKSIVGNIGGSLADNTYWQESLSVNMELKNNRLWLSLKPSIWIEPHTNRQFHIDFIRNRKRSRYNVLTNSMYNAWIKILFGDVKLGTTIETECYSESEFPVKFQINTRTTFSQL